jgi:hypothetical protein
MNINTTYYLIDSRDRNATIYKEPNQYVIFMNDIIKNVISVKLVYAMYPKHGNEFYTNLHIDEFSYNAEANNQHLRHAFTQLPTLHYVNEYKPETGDGLGKNFDQPISKLSKFTISFIDYDGSLTIIGEHLLKFEIRHYVYDGNPEMNTTLTNPSNIFNLPVKYTSKDLNIAYKKIRKEATSEAHIRELKNEYLRLFELIS